LAGILFQARLVLGCLNRQKAPKGGRIHENHDRRPDVSQINQAAHRAMFERRSIRSFTDQPVEPHEVETMLEAGRWAPSGKNNQPWRFLVVSGDDPRRSGLAGATKYSAIVEQAPVLLCVFLHKPTMYAPVKDHQSAGACIQNILLSAHAQGLGAVWLGEIINQESEVMRVLGLDSGEYELMAVVAAGRPAREGSSSRRPLSELMLEDL
jgi:nitroreductase